MAKEKSTKVSVTLSDNGQNQWDGSLCDVLQIVVWTFVLFSLAIVLSVHLLFTETFVISNNYVI
jgi:hypothetical protein